MRAHGIDISHWQSYYHHKENPPRPVDFIVQKLTEGIYRDPSYTTLKAQIQPVPIKGGYHYFRGQWNWKVQMDTFLSQLNGYDFYALDIEKQGNYSGLAALNKPYPGYIESIPLALEYLKANTDKPGLLYTGAGTWMDWLKPIVSDLVLYDLWVAHYWWKPNPEGIPNYFTIKGAETMRRDWRFWQYTDKACTNNGQAFGVGSYGLDLDVFNGDLDDLNAWVHPIPAKRCPTCGQVWKE
jgi:GH25 family lysozyme M1 (1,4-beta-N-acetylmuramidase)